MPTMTFPPPDPLTRRAAPAPQPAAAPSRPRRSRPTLFAAWGMLILVSFGIGFAGRTTLARPHARPATVRSGTAEAAHAEIVSMLESRYFRFVDTDSLLSTPIDTLPAALDDPYTRFMTAEQYERFMAEESATAAAIGITANTAPTGLLISSVFPGSPAARAGLTPGDVVLSAGEHSLEGLGLVDALSLLRGPDSSVVPLVLDRAGARVTTAVTRQATYAWMVASDIRTVGSRRVGYVALLDFGEGAGDRVRTEVRRLVDAGVAEIVFDLRGNPGGWAREAVRVAEIFLPKGSAVFTERGANIKTTTYFTKAAPETTALPMTVLVDQETASSAEIVTAALRDAHRARVVGETTFGKGRIQDVTPLSTGGALKFTFAEYLTPDGTAIDRVGIVPDVFTDTASIDGTAAAVERTSGIARN